MMVEMVTETLGENERQEVKLQTIKNYKENGITT
jgi:hypothetical protein